MAEALHAAETESVKEAFFTVATALMAAERGEAHVPTLCTAMQTVLLRMHARVEFHYPPGFTSVMRTLLPLDGDEDVGVTPDVAVACLRFVAPFVHRHGLRACAAADAAAGGDEWVAAADASAAASHAKFAADDGEEASDPRIPEWCAALVSQAVAAVAAVDDGDARSRAVAWGSSLFLRCGYNLQDVLGARNPPSPPPPGAASGSDSDSDYEDVDRRVPWSMAGVGAFAHAALVAGVGAGQSVVPSMVPQKVWLQAVVTPVQALLGWQARSLVPRRLGLELLERALVSIAADSHTFINRMQLGQSTPEFQLCQQLISFIVTCPDATLRRRGYATFNTYLTKFKPGLRYWLLRNLILACPFDQVKGLLLDTLRRDANSRWGTRPYHDNSLLDLLYEILSEFSALDAESLDDKFDLHLGVVNFYRFLLLRDRKGEPGHVTQVWSKDAVDRMRLGYISMLSTAITTAEREASSTADADVPPQSATSPLNRLSLLSAALMPVMDLLD